MIAKNMTNGKAIFKTSKGTLTIAFPFKQNIVTIVNNNAIKVIGEIAGINLRFNHSSPLVLIKIIRVNYS